MNNKNNRLCGYKKTTDYPYASTTSDYLDWKKNTTNQTETNENQQRQIRIQDAHKPGFEQNKKP